MEAKREEEMRKNDDNQKSGKQTMDDSFFKNEARQYSRPCDAQRAS
jgi:hypothetical protein